MRSLNAVAQCGRAMRSLTRNAVAQCGRAMRSRNAIAFLKSVVASTVLKWVRPFARQRAAKPEPRPGGVSVMELDAIWHFVGRKANKLWIWLALGRDTGQLVDWPCGDRDQATLDQPPWTSCWRAWRPGTCAAIVRMLTCATIRRGRLGTSLSVRKSR